jgi:hypothetical protein
VGRLSAPARFRAKAWEDLTARPDVWDLSSCAHKLLCAIVWKQLTPYNNGNLTLGPRTLKEYGIRGRRAVLRAIEELKKRNLLSQMGEARSGTVTHYAFPWLPVTFDPRPIFAAERQLRRCAPANGPTPGHVDVQNPHEKPVTVETGGPPKPVTPETEPVTVETG